MAGPRRNPFQPNLWSIIGRNIRFYRLRRDLSLDELAKLADVKGKGRQPASSILRLIEQGRRGVTFRAYCRIARVLRVTIADLLDEPREP